MRAGNHTYVALLIGFTACAAAGAAPGNTLQDELRIFTDDTAAQCGALQQQLEVNDKSDRLTAYTLKDAVRSLCVCMPARTQALRDRFSAEELTRQISEEEFLALFNPAVINPCAGEQLQALYGADCRKRFRKSQVDARRYCSCMKEVVSGYSDSTAAAIAMAAGDYLPLAAQAEEKGEPAPPRPAVLEAYYQADRECKAEKP